MAYPTNKPTKRRKISLSHIAHVRNGGSDDSFLPVDAAPWACEDDGSDTEEEKDEEMEQFFLNKMTDDTDRKTETVFGKGVKVWKSIGGTVYADLEDKVKRKQRAEELWGPKRKREDEGTLDEKKSLGKDKKGNGEVQYSTLPAIPPISPYPPPPPTIAYRPRTAHDTMYHRGSAGIDPLGAYNRPIKALPTHHRGAEALPSPPNRIVSGSFGSFEVRQPSRFDERPYRLLPKIGTAGKDKKEDSNKPDPFKGKPWLRLA